MSILNQLIQYNHCPGERSTDAVVEDANASVWVKFAQGLFVDICRLKQERLRLYPTTFRYWPKHTTEIKQRWLTSV
jgi:hypothetical protein